MFKGLIVLAFVFCGSAFAHEGDHGHGGGPGHHGGMGECKPLKEACEKAGFTMGGHKKDGKGIIVDCMGKFAKGEKVEGVSLDPADPTLKPCMEKLAAKKEMREEKRAERKAAKKAAKEAAKADGGAAAGEHKGH
jgi:hypothetical protein